MIIDSSAAAAVCLGEPDAEIFEECIELADDLVMGAATYLEAGIVIDGRRPGAFDTFVTAMDVQVIPMDREQADLARAAYRRFGRGSGHPAALNLGDCFSYALAIHLARPLLFKGEDFRHTDVTPALP